MMKSSEQAGKTNGTAKKRKDKASQPEVVSREEAADVTIYVQSILGGSISIDEITARVHATDPGAEEIYVKPEENRAYYVGKDARGYVVLWE